MARVVRVLAVLSIVLCLTSCERLPEALIHVDEEGGMVRIPVELAVTEQQRAHGLMYRRDLSADAGMLFVFPETAIHPFWMKNTPLPLDMIFVGEDLLVVGIVENTVPFSESRVSVARPSRYVLEVNAGFAARTGIGTGNRVQFRNLTTPIAQS